jgi:hypothetical protein
VLNHFIDLVLVFGEKFERALELFSAQRLRGCPASAAAKGREQFGRHFVDWNAAGTTALDFVRISQRAFAPRTTNLPDLAR